MISLILFYFIIPYIVCIGIITAVILIGEKIADKREYRRLEGLLMFLEVTRRFGIFPEIKEKS